MLSKGWIKANVFSYGAPALFVKKKTGKLRMCIGLGSPNANTKLVVLSLPRIADFLDK